MHEAKVRYVFRVLVGVDPVVKKKKKNSGSSAKKRKSTFCKKKKEYSRSLVVLDSRRVNITEKELSWDF